MIDYNKIQIEEEYEETIADIDRDILDIENQIKILKAKLENRLKDRKQFFLDKSCELKYRITEDEEEIKLLRKRFLLTLLATERAYVFYSNVNDEEMIYLAIGTEQIAECMKTPNEIARNIPNKYKNDFLMLYSEIHEEAIKWNKYKKEQNHKEQEEYSEAWQKLFDELNNISTLSSIDEAFYRKCYKLLAKSFHPDAQGSEEDMKMLNELKVVWGI